MAYQARSRRGVMISVKSMMPEAEWVELEKRLTQLDDAAFWRVSQSIIDSSLGAIARIVKEKLNGAVTGQV
jgi:hypothetical protein